jgi:hypothetical protein
MTFRHDHPPIKKAIAVGTSALLLAGSTPPYAAGAAQGGPNAIRYTFVTVLDSQRDGLRATRCPAINVFGRLAVTVSDTVLGGTKIITKLDATDVPVVIADTQAAPDFPTLCDNGFNALPSDPSINEAGEVAFQGNLRRLSDLARPECATAAQRARRQGVFLGAGGSLTTIAHTINPPGGDFVSEFLVADQSVNTSGRVAFVPELDGTFDQGLFIGSKNGTFEQRFLADHPTPDGFNFNNLSSRVSLNEAGQVAFESGLNNADVSGIFLSNPDGTFRTVVDNSGVFASVGDPSLNIFGRVAFTADRFDNKGNQIFSINTSRGDDLVTVAESRRGGYQSFREPSLNDLGMVAFTADVQPDPKNFTTVQGVFTGSDPVRDKVLQAGDVYEGVVVTSIVTCAEALNDLGQIVMTVQSQDPDTFETRTFIVTATPVRRDS